MMQGRPQRLTVALAGALLLSLSVLMPLSARAEDSEEAQAGAQLFAQLRSQGEIVKSSPLYNTLRPIAAAITKAVQPRYQYPIHFYLVHEGRPNAFAAPGGNIYVVDALLYFVKNTEELAGTLCHESSHLIHHDSMAKMKHDEEIRKRAIAATIVFGPSIGHFLTLQAIGRLDADHYSRGVEESADLTGADTCSAAGYNPWGLVWLFRDFENAQLSAPPEILSDHPNDAHRIERLKQHFADNPGTFSKWSSSPKTAKPLHVPANEQEQFLR